MIAVIADDFTGAAELAGISLRFGLTVELCVDEVKYKNAELLVVSTDSRSLNREAALHKTEKAIKKILQLHPSFIYKKTDSVLRGHIVDEIKIQMQLMDKKKAFFMPANPSLGRTISNGEYFVNGIKLNETSFAADPEFPITSPFVKQVLHNEVEVLKPGSKLPARGIVVGEVTTADDYTYWADKADDSWILAGTGDFFTALLIKKYKQIKVSTAVFQQTFLYVCGTAFTERKEELKKMQQPVCYIKKENDGQVLHDAATMLNQKHDLIIAFDNETDFSDCTAAELRKRMALLTKQIVEQNAVKELFIEGGSTAAAILQELDITMLQPVNELSRGVVRMQAGDLFITVKPGSYQLPEEVKRLFTI